MTEIKDEISIISFTTKNRSWEKSVCNNELFLGGKASNYTQISGQMRDQFIYIVDTRDLNSSALEGHKVTYPQSTGFASIVKSSLAAVSYAVNMNILSSNHIKHDRFAPELTMIRTEQHIPFGVVIKDYLFEKRKALFRRGIMNFSKTSEYQKYYKGNKISLDD